MKAEVIAWIIGTVLAIAVISCSESSTGADTERCTRDATDSTVTCGDTQFMFY